MFDWIEAHPASTALITTIVFAVLRLVSRQINRGNWRAWASNTIWIGAGGVYLLLLLHLSQDRPATTGDVRAVLAFALLLPGFMVLALLYDLNHATSRALRRSRTDISSEDSKEQGLRTKPTEPHE